MYEFRFASPWFASISALIAFGISSGVYAKIVSTFSEQMMVLTSTGFVDAVYMTKTLVWIFIALGVAIGAEGSIISMRRYLKE